MSKMHGDHVELTDMDAAVVKGMIERGDKNETIAAFFGVNQRAISYVRSGKKFENIKPARKTNLPPPGPYGVDPIYISFYRTMARVNELWEGKQLAQAKELLEQALENPVFIHDLDDIGEVSASMFRDEFGLSKVK